MRHKLLITTAAIALLAGTGFASAQATKERGEGAAPAPAAQQRAPAEKMGPSTTGQGSSAVTPMEKSKSAETPKTSAPKSTTGQAPSEKSSADTKAKSDTSIDSKSKSTMDKNSAGTKSNTTVNEKNEHKSNTTLNEKDKSGSRATTGQGSAATAAKLSTEQRTKITTVIKQKKVAPVTKVNFSISIGTRVPRTVHLYPLPVEVVEVYPAWRGFEYIVVENGEIVVIDPHTLEIVAVLQA